MELNDNDESCTKFGMPSPFLLERYFAQHEFSAAHPICCSDCEPIPMSDLLQMADEECKDLWENLTLGYTESDGHPRLRKEIAKLYESEGVKAADIIVMVPQEAIQIACRVILQEPEGHIICTGPAYQSLYEHAKVMGYTIDFWDYRTDGEGNLYYDARDLEPLKQHNTRAVFVNFPHNPTGCVLSHANWQILLDFCQKLDAYLFSDEMYRLLELDAEDRRPSLAVYNKAVILSGMSKAFGLAGLRLGWLVTKDEGIFKKLQQLHDYYSICHVGPAEILAIIALQNKDKIIERNLGIIRTNIRIAEAFFSKHKGNFEFRAPKASSVTFPRLVTRQPIHQFCDNLVKECGVFLLPADMYKHESASKQNRFRLGLGRKNLGDGLKVLDSYICCSNGKERICQLSI